MSPATGNSHAALFLGDNGFIGVDHWMRGRSRDRAAEMTPPRMLAVLDAALGSGAKGYVFSVHPKNYELLRHMRAEGYHRSFDLYGLLPYAQSYVRQATEQGAAGMLKEMIGRLPWKEKAGVILGVGSSVVTANPFGALRAYLDLELEAYLRVLPRGARLSAVFLHEVVTDLALAFSVEPLFLTFVEHIRRRYGAVPGFVTRNFPLFVRQAAQMGLSAGGIAVMTPFNPAGFQMNPSRTACEEALARVSRSEVIAMSILAGGYVPLADAVGYLNALPRNVSVVVGTIRVAHARETFAALRPAAD